MDNNDLAIRFEHATPEQAFELAPFIYESARELLDFIFSGREAAEKALGRLIARRRGHFSHHFVTRMLVGDELCGVALGYDARQLAAEETRGAANMLRAVPMRRWPHLIGPVSRALDGYVPPLSPGAYYINNIAVDSEHRGQGHGSEFLAHISEMAKQQGYRFIELDVTDNNEAARRFYERHGFHCVAESRPEKAVRRYGLPGLQRMRLLLNDERRVSTDNEGRPTSSVVINDVSGLNPIEVDEVYAPGSIEQLQTFLRNTDRPISVGGARFSMGGQIAQPGTLHIDMRGLNRILEIDPAEKTIRVEAGARWKDVQQAVDDYGLAVKVMQTYSSFTVGGSLSVNCHGRYVGLGPVILSVRSIRIVLHDGECLEATPDSNPEIFYGAIGGYGALGIITEVTLELADNARIERSTKKMKLIDYPAFFQDTIRNDDKVVFHNADMVPPNFDTIRAVSWRETDKPVNRKPQKEGRKLYLLEKYMLWAITESPFGHKRREYFYEPLLYGRSKVVWRNDEADYDVAELEPLSRENSTYVLQEYFVPVDDVIEFSGRMTEILKRHKVNVVNVSIRHAHADPGSMLAWAKSEVFALVLYYKQGTDNASKDAVGVWTRELIDAALSLKGGYYLPYQPHGRPDQFHAAYPRARELFELKRRLDPDYRFRNSLWTQYYEEGANAPLANDAETGGSEFRQVFGDIQSRDDFFRFLQVIYNLYPEDRFHRLIVDACERYDTDRAIYDYVAYHLPGIKPALADLTHALPALKVQKQEMVDQTRQILAGKTRIDGYLEIGTTGRYVKGLRKALGIRGPLYLTNDIAPDYSLPSIVERGSLRKVGTFFDLDGYKPIPSSKIPDASLDLVTCYIGLHHCPREKLSEYIASIHRVLRLGGCLVLRDHDAGSDEMRTFCSLVHSVFNVGLGEPWSANLRELRLFNSVDYWVDEVKQCGFSDTGKRLLQANDPSLNTLMCFVKDTEI